MAPRKLKNLVIALPALHPAFGKSSNERKELQFTKRLHSSSLCFQAIPTEPNGGNHSPEFEKSARSEAAHEATMVITRGLALLGFRVLTDEVFFAKVKGAINGSVNRLIPHLIRFSTRLKSRKQLNRNPDLLIWLHHWDSIKLQILLKINCKSRNDIILQLQM